MEVIVNDYPTPVTVSSNVYLDAEQFTQLIDQGRVVQSNQSYIFIVLAVIVGVLIMQQFWNGWRSGK